MSGEKPPVEFCKGVNGLDKVVLREVKGSSAEVRFVPLFSRSRSVTFFFVLSSSFTNSRRNEISLLASEFRFVSDSIVLDLIELLMGLMVLGVFLV